MAICLTTAGWLCAAPPGAALAQGASDLMFNQQPVSRFYVGGSIAWVHHTGYVPHKSKVPPIEADAVDAYVWGGKAFGGYRIADWIQVETGFHYLGNAPFTEGFGTATYTSWVRSYAFSGSFVFAFPPLTYFLGPNSLPLHVFLRAGLAYKNVRHQSVFATNEEGMLSGVLGLGIEYKLTPRLFTRLEVEHLTTAIGGPSQTTPLIKGTVPVSFGGTNNVANVMNTQIMLSLASNL
jgi:hypothetical protein